MFKSIIEKMKQYRFLFEELVKRDFTKKYKRTVLGMAWAFWRWFSRSFSGATWSII